MYSLAEQQLFSHGHHKSVTRTTTALQILESTSRNPIAPSNRDTFTMFALREIFLISLLFQRSIIAHPFGEVFARDGVCSSGIYGELSGILASYPVAVSFCKAVYPVKCSKGKRELEPRLEARGTTTTTTTTKPTTTTTKSTTTTKPTTTTTKPTTTTKSTTTTVDAKASAWSKCQGQGGNVVSTMCSCIQGPPTVSRIVYHFYSQANSCSVQRRYDMRRSVVSCGLTS